MSDEILEAIIINFLEPSRREIRPALVRCSAEKGKLDCLFGLFTLHESKTFAEHLAGVLVCVRTRQPIPIVLSRSPYGMHPDMA
ncbi:MAG: hypothetical protein M3Y49_04490 [Actinomycetota bacterium]|nr:hypothetical protein [Actinomycetota bacterium]